LSIQDLLVYNKMKLQDFFKDYVRFAIKDYGTINFNYLVKISGKKYSITSYDYDLVNNDLQIEVSEQLENTPTVIYSDTNLSTVDGK